jgi:GT2 family glycosyltransferase
MTSNKQIEYLDTTSKNIQIPRVSIVIVNYNGYRWLKMFMPYFLHTRYPNFEIIVVDNASNDESVKYLRHNFNNIQVIELKENKGFAEGTNFGARAASGEVLAFLNNDMEVPEDWLIEATSKLMSNELVAAVQCKIMQFENKNMIEAIGLSVDKYGIAQRIGYNEVDVGQYDNLKEIGACAGGAMLIWKHIFLELGCFDPLFFMYYEDIDLSWRIKLTGYKILPATSSIIYHVGSPSTDINQLIAFHKVKNLICCWLKYSRLKVIATYWFIVPSMALYWSMFSMVKGRPCVALSQFKAIFWSAGHIKYILGERKRIKNLNKSRPKNDDLLFVNGVNKGSSNLSYVITSYRSRMKNNKKNKMDHRPAKDN